MTNKSKSDQEFESLKIRAAICPGLETRWEPPEFVHWAALHKASELRSSTSKGLASMDAVSGDPDLNPEGKLRKKQTTGRKALAQQEESVGLQKARDAVERQLRRWSSEIAAAVRPASTEAEAVLHGLTRASVCRSSKRAAVILSSLAPYLRHQHS